MFNLNKIIALLFIISSCYAFAFDTKEFSLQSYIAITTKKMAANTLDLSALMQIGDRYGNSVDLSADLGLAELILSPQFLNRNFDRRDDNVAALVKLGLISIGQKNIQEAQIIKYGRRLEPLLDILASIENLNNISGSPEIINVDLVSNRGQLVTRKFLLGNKIGEGTFGLVSLAYELHEYEIDKNNKNWEFIIKYPYVAKKFKDVTSKKEPLEIKFTRQFGMESFWGHCQTNSLYIISEFVGDMDLPCFMSGSNFIHAYADLNPLERADLSRALGLALLNVERVGLIHLDLKPQNIRIGVNKIEDKNNKVQRFFDATIVDFGLSVNRLMRNGNKWMDPFDLKIFAAVQSHGTFLFVSPEVLYSQEANNTTDVYSMAPIFMAIYGATQPLGSRNTDLWKFGNNFHEAAKGWAFKAYWSPNLQDFDFDTTGMFTHQDYLGRDMTFAVDFAKRMGRGHYKKRPSVNEWVLFNNFFYQYEKNFYEGKKNIYDLSFAGWIGWLGDNNSLIEEFWLKANDEYKKNFRQAMNEDSAWYNYFLDNKKYNYAQKMLEFINSAEE